MALALPPLVPGVSPEGNHRGSESSGILRHARERSELQPRRSKEFSLADGQSHNRHAGTRLQHCYNDPHSAWCDNDREGMSVSM
jgi:hypothetical protein